MMRAPDAHALRDLQPSRAQVLAEVLAGLSRQPRQLPSKYFYDAEGSALFEAITRLPEYYLTRTELALLEASMAQIAEQVGPRAHVIELGSGSGRKTALLLAGLLQPVAYTPVEISRQALLGSVHSLQQQLPQVQMLPVCADFTRPFVVPPAQLPAARRLLFFPGSTLGNFDNQEAVGLLATMAGLIGDDGLVLLGVDLHQDPARIEAAYNDAQGVTAAFTLNMLRRFNREIGSDFDLDGFRHRAVYNREQRRIETDLVSQRQQVVQLGGQRFAFAAGEAVHVEYSHKYSDDSLAALAAAAGLRVCSGWTAQAPDFALRLLCRA